MKCSDCTYTTNNKKSISNHRRYGCTEIRGSWRERNKKYLKIYAIKWRKEHKKEIAEKLKIYSPLWRARNPEKVKLNRKRTRDKLRTDVLNAYGYKCQCCGETQKEFLSIDHMNGNGRKHRRENKLGNAQAFYLWLKRNNYPTEFQVLCHNCNCAKGYYGRCPHAA